MIIKKIKLINYRNYRRINIKFHPTMNLLLGANAQGKTNILESIYVLALSKSYRAGVERDYIRFTASKASIAATIFDHDIIKDLQIDFHFEGRTLKINQTEIKKVADYISNLKVILFTPDDLEIVKGSPNVRRNLLNIQISQISKEYLIALNEYNKILKTRNEYLKILYTSNLADRRYFDVLTDQLIKKAIVIYQERKKYIEFINENISSIFFDITGESSLKICYEPNLELENYTEEEITEKLRKKYKKNYSRELAQGMTLYGPHRDDFSYFLQDLSLKSYGSQGQQRLTVICHKLAEVLFFEKETGTKPVLLLDDVLSEIDKKKKNNLLRYINHDIQCIITATDLKDIDRRSLKDYKIFSVENGEITEKEG